MKSKNEFPDHVLIPCTPQKYGSLVDFLDVAFGKKEKHWFPKYYGHIFRNEPEAIACNYLYHHKGKLAGAIGIYPSKLRIGKAVLDLGGVGSVSTHPNARGKGVMSGMLKQVVDILQKKYDVSWLAGARFRYRNYGWELGGRRVFFSVLQNDLVRYYPDIKPGKIRKATIKDIPLMAKCYSKFTTGTARTKESWKLLFKRGCVDMWVYDGPEGKAYLTNEWGAQNVEEINGSDKAIVALLNGYFAKQKKTDIRISMPDTGHSPSPLLYHICSHYVIEHCCQIRVCNVSSAWSKLVPEIITRFYPGGEQGMSTLFDDIAGEKDRRAILNRALGFFDNTPPLPKHLSAFEDVRPLKWWISFVDGV